MKTEPLGEVVFGSTSEWECQARFSGGHQFISGPKGRIEVSSVGLEERRREQVVYFLPGWWGNLSDYGEVMRYFADLGYGCRCFSWRGTGRSEGGSFWGRGYEGDLLAVIRAFKDEAVIAIPHSGAVDPTREALPLLHKTGFQPVRAAIMIAPLARSGAMGALWRWLRPDGSGTDLKRFVRFLGSNILGVDWFMRNELAVRRVLMSDEAPEADVQRVMRQIDNCPFGRYFLSLWRFPRFVQHRPIKLADFGVEHALVLHSELDRNFTREQQWETAMALGAEFNVLPQTCHQWFAEPHSFRTTTECILQWLARKGLYS